ncbi:MAG TPA: 16S rRNA (adenine(1518)-N(6)/adenine(1519)-N(6))-dimethyltransferase RsmA [Bacteroidia bacterium]|nr:16S rRNA (adenine(1518)-N(6)/adenine(1519)-N(6))-dimethyltransferase RsmA [Bacteroidia bacterium]
MSVRPKKFLGQHFLKDAATAAQIVSFLSPHAKNILEIGPGKGILTQFLFQKKNCEVKIIEIDNEAIQHLLKIFLRRKQEIIQGDFLEMNLQGIFGKPFSIIGNFPYNISSQILFRALENKDKVEEVIGMFQKEVAERIVSPPGNRDYGILSVFVQAFYDVEIVMTLNEEDFSPPPKVKSAVIRLRRNRQNKLMSDEKIFFRVVKTAFNQRRKKLSNALSSLIQKNNQATYPYLDLRAEALSWKQFDELALLIGKTHPV